MLHLPTWSSPSNLSITFCWPNKPPRILSQSLNHQQCQGLKASPLHQTLHLPLLVCLILGMKFSHFSFSLVQETSFFDYFYMYTTLLLLVNKMYTHISYY